MRRRFLVIGIILLFVCVSFNPSFAFYNPVSSSNTLYVGGSGEGNYTKIQDAINDAVDGDIVFVYDDSSPYYEHCTLRKSIRLIGENKETTIIDGMKSSWIVYIIDTNEVNINGFTFKNAQSGVLIQSDNNIIKGNIFINNEIGIRLDFIADSNKILGNIFRNNSNGILLNGYPGDRNIIKKNNFMNNTRDVYFNYVDRPMKNYWNNNYWNQPRLLPKPIHGTLYIAADLYHYTPFNWLNFDWRPALKPYDI